VTPAPRLPDYGSGSLADVLPAVLRGLGVANATDAGRAVNTADPADGTGGLALEVTDRVCLVRSSRHYGSGWAAAQSRRFSRPRRRSP
jgi:hypothetical protein